jgi:hypothetical protein
VQRHIADELKSGLRLIARWKRRGQADSAFWGEHEVRKLLRLKRAGLNVVVTQRLVARQRP